MVLVLEEEEENLFPHSRRTESGGGKERIGQATIIVSLDGTGDTDNIQEGIDMLKNKNGEVFIKEGIHIIRKGIEVKNKNDITIRGTGKGTIIKLVDNAKSIFLSPTTIKIIALETCKNIVIKDLKIDGNLTNNSGTSLQISAYCIEARDTFQSIFENLFITDYIYKSGILLIGLNEPRGRNIVNNCIFESGTGPSSRAIEVNEPEDIISNNIIENTVGIGITFDFAGSCIITGNQVRNTFGQGIEVGSSFVANNCIIGENISKGNRREGIRVGTGSNILIDSNICTDNEDGIFLAGNDCVVSNNICEGNSAHGISLDNADNCIVNGNQSRGNNEGLEIDADVDRTIVMGNHIRGNTTAQVIDNGTNTYPNGTSGTTNLALDDLNIIA